MKRGIRDILFLTAIPALAWGVFLIEDGLFNTGSADIREFFIGLGVVVVALTVIVQRLCDHGWFAQVSPLLRVSALILLGAVYSASTWSRWSHRDEHTQLAAAEAMIVAHVKNSNEWIMIDKALLRRPAHWYESGVQVIYLRADNQQAVSIQLPAKFLSLSTAKER